MKPLLTDLQQATLIFVAARPGCSSAEVYRAVTHGRDWQMLGALCVKGMLHRYSIRENGRQTRFTLTEKGRTYLERRNALP